MRVLSDSCDGFSRVGHTGCVMMLCGFVQSLGYCKELGYVVAFSGRLFNVYWSKVSFQDYS